MAASQPDERVKIAAGLVAILGFTLWWVGEPVPDFSAQATYRMDVNHADAATLELLPGVGPALAGRLVEDRDRRGPFRDGADLQRVHGIGPVIADAISPHVQY